MLISNFKKTNNCEKKKSNVQNVTQLFVFLKFEILFLCPCTCTVAFYMSQNESEKSETRSKKRRRVAKNESHVKMHDYIAMLHCTHF